MLLYICVLSQIYSSFWQAVSQYPPLAGVGGGITKKICQLILIQTLMSDLGKFSNPEQDTTFLFTTP
jgi:hypothetical protein